jgi:hypothetical protein
MARERYSEDDFEAYGRAYDAAIAEAGGEQPVKWAEITPAITDAYNYANERLGLELVPQALPRQQQGREVVSRRQRSKMNVSPWAAGALVIVALAAGSEAYNHLANDETQESPIAAGSNQSGSYNLADVSNDSLEDKCFDHPMNPDRGPLRTSEADTIEVVADAKEIRIGAVEATVVVPRGIHVGVITVCGAKLNVDGSVQQAVMFGAEAHLDVADNATVDSGSVEGGNACASGNLNGQIYAERC